MKKYTIRDIAEMAGVSKGTVDRVLHKRGKVSDVALEKVTKVLDKIEYKPNLIAKNLKNNKTYKICVLLPTDDLDSYWSPCIEGIEEAKEAFQSFGVDFETHQFNASNTKSFYKKALDVINLKPDALLMVPLFQKEAKEIATLCNKKNIKISFFNNNIRTDFPTNFIGQDLYQSGRVAAKLLDILLKKGHIGIIHIDEDYQNATHLQEKERGFKSYFNSKKSSNFKFSTINLQHIGSNNFDEAIIEFLNNNPTINGLFVTISKSYAVAETLKNSSKHIAIVGYDLVKQNIDFLKQGNIDFLIHQKPKQQIFNGLSQLAEYFLFDKEIPNQLLLPIDIVNSENIDGYLL